MMKTGKWRTRSFGYFGATALALVIGGAASARAAPADDNGATLTEVVVTANRREERNQDVPIAITAFTSQRMEQLNISKPQDLQANVPSLTVGAAGQGSREVQSPTIRGQGATFQASPGVVVYLNEVPLPSAVTISQQGGPGNYLDLENMQVLSGPQGTLFGRNTTGGAILLVPHKPTNSFEGWAEARYGNHDDKEFRGVVNVPIVDDKLLMRLAGEFQDRDGYTHDVTFNKDRDNVHYYASRFGLTFRPTDSFENYFMAYDALSKNNGTGLIHRGFNIAGLQGVGFCVDPPLTPPGPSGIATSCDVYRAATAQANALGPRATAPSVDAYQKTQTSGFTNTTRYSINDDLTLRNIVSLQKLKIFMLYDSDATLLQQADVGAIAGRLPPGYFDGGAELPINDQKQFTEELQLQGKMLDQHLIWTLGGFYYDQKPDGAQGISEIVYCPALFTGFCAPQQISSGVRSKSKALYAQATFDFGAVSPALDRLKLTAGYRYTWDQIDGAATAFTPQPNGALLCSNTNQVSSTPDACRFEGHLRSAAPTWTVGLDYKVNVDMLLYGKVSRGYKAGGFNPYAVRESTRTFSPEYVTSYEAGIKSDWRLWGMPARLNADYYYLNYQDIQRTGGDFNPAIGAAGAAILTATARIQGVELEGTIKPTSELEIGGTFSYTDAKYKTFHYTPLFPTPDCSSQVIAPGGTASAACLPFQYVAPRIYSMHLAWNHPLPDNNGEMALFVNYSHSAAQYTEAFLLPQLQPGAYLEPFGLLNLSLDWNKVAGKPLDVGFFMTNALNKLYRISNTNVYQAGSLLTWATIYGEPRMFGVRVRYRFGS